MLVVLLDDRLEEKKGVDDKEEVEGDKEVEDREVEVDDGVRDRYRDVGCRDHRVVTQIGVLDARRQFKLDDHRVDPIDVLEGLVLELVVRVVDSNLWVDPGIDTSSYTLVTRCFFSSRSIRSLSLDRHVVLVVCDLDLIVLLVVEIIGAVVLDCLILGVVVEAIVLEIRVNLVGVVSHIVVDLDVVVHVVVS